MNVIFENVTYTGTKLMLKDGHLFLDDRDLGECDNPKFRASTIDGKVYMSQWDVIDGGANV